jgi:FKBP-type peptidyl-prolyl cis-trans isomerase
MHFIRQSLLVGLSVIGLTVVVWPARAEDAGTKLTSDADKFSYVVGMDIGATIKRLGPDAPLNPELILRAIQDVLTGKEPLLDTQQANEIRLALSRKLQERMAAEMKQAAEKNRTEGEAFLANNKTREGVTTTASGLQYEVLTAGTGEKPKDSDVVTVNYRGTLLDGSEFDSSYKRGKPATFPVKGVIAGWTEGLQLMSVGGKYRLYIPTALAYGERGAGRNIGPNATLIFDIELLSIGKAEDKAAKPAVPVEVKPEAKPEAKPEVKPEVKP